MDVLSGLGLAVDENAFTLVVLLSLVHVAFESAGGASISVDVVGELAGTDFLNFGDSRGDLGFVTSSATVLELHGVGRIGIDLVFRHWSK